MHVCLWARGAEDEHKGSHDEEWAPVNRSSAGAPRFCNQSLGSRATRKLGIHPDTPALSRSLAARGIAVAISHSATPQVHGISETPLRWARKLDQVRDLIRASPHQSIECGGCCRRVPDAGPEHGGRTCRHHPEQSAIEDRRGLCETRPDTTLWLGSVRAGYALRAGIGFKIGLCSNRSRVKTTSSLGRCPMEDVSHEEVLASNVADPSLADEIRCRQERNREALVDGRFVARSRQGCADRRWLGLRLAPTVSTRLRPVFIRSRCAVPALDGRWAWAAPAR